MPADTTWGATVMSSRPCARSGDDCAGDAGACQKKDPNHPRRRRPRRMRQPGRRRSPCRAEPAAAPALTPQPNRSATLTSGDAPHTSWSVDAWVMGNRLTGRPTPTSTPKRTIKHPMVFRHQIDTTLDFMGVTDHSSMLGVTSRPIRRAPNVSTLPARSR